VALPPSDLLSCGLASHTKEISYTQKSSQQAAGWNQRTTTKVARHKITEKSTSVQTFRKERYRKTKEKMARCSVKTEQANA
jgi:hypothetical protein